MEKNKEEGKQKELDREESQDKQIQGNRAGSAGWKFPET